MGVHPNITMSKFPAQRKGPVGVGSNVKVYYGYNMSEHEQGTILRMDTEEPGVCIILTKSGRLLLDTECQYSAVSTPTGT